MNAPLVVVEVSTGGQNRVGSGSNCVLRRGTTQALGAELDQVIASNCPPITTYHWDFGPFALDGSPTPFDGVAEAYAPRRTVLDKILVDAAVQAGAELREGFPVAELVTDGQRVTGIRGRTSVGAAALEHARIVIGADGMHSQVVRWVSAPEYNAKPPLQGPTLSDGDAVLLGHLCTLAVGHRHRERECARHGGGA